MHEVPWEVFSCISWEAILSLKGNPILNCRALWHHLFAGSKGRQQNKQTPASSYTKATKTWNKHLIIAAILQLKKKHMKLAGNEDKTLGEPEKQTNVLGFTYCIFYHALMVMEIKEKVLEGRPGAISTSWNEKYANIPTYFVRLYIVYIDTLLNVKCKERRPANSKFFSDDFMCFQVQSNNSASSVAMAKSSRSRAAVHAVAAQPLRPLEPRVLNGPLAHKVEWLKFVTPLGNNIFSFAYSSMHP